MRTMKLMALALLVMMTGCKSGEKSLLSLKGHEWQLETMQKEGEIVKNPSQLPVLQFSDTTTVAGSAGCNRFFGGYTADAKGNLTIQPGGSTMMFCPDMEFEDQYLKALSQVKSFSADSEKLVLKSEDGKLQLTYTFLK